MNNNVKLLEQFHDKLVIRELEPPSKSIGLSLNKSKTALTASNSQSPYRSDTRSENESAVDNTTTKPPLVCPVDDFYGDYEDDY